MTSREASNNSVKSKRIAFNAIALFLRMIGIMVVNLYAVRIVLHALGEEDYGIYNAVAGIVLFSTFITSTLAVSIQRFYSYTMGEQKPEKLSAIFSASLNIVMLLALSIVLILELVGPVLIQTQMTIPAERLAAAQWIFQFSLLTLLCSLLQLPFTAAIFAHEDMGSYSLISFLECVARLIVAYLIGVAAFDGLVFYGAGLLLVAIGVLATYIIVARHHYVECRRYYKKVDKTVYTELLSFSGWTMYGTVAGISIIQGTTILLNIFFGPLANAAYAIANQIYNAANTLCHSIVLAFRPAMIRAYAERDFTFLDNLFIASNKFILYLLIAVSLPLLVEIRTVFSWWLGTVSESTILFSRLFLIYMICLSISNPITTVIQATGHIKNYYLIVDTITLFCLPITWLLFNMGMPSWSAFASMIALCIACHALRLILLQREYPSFSFTDYLLQLILPCLLIAVVSTVLTIAIHQAIGDKLLRFFAVGIASPLAVIALAFIFGTSKTDRQYLRQVIHKNSKR